MQACQRTSGREHLAPGLFVLAVAYQGSAAGPGLGYGKQLKNATELQRVCQLLSLCGRGGGDLN